MLTCVLEIRGTQMALIDEPLALRARGGGAVVRWRARLVDDDARAWRSQAPRAEELASAWTPAKSGTGPVAALASLRPVRFDVRAETEDGAAASRTVERRLLADGVKVRRWRDPAPAATLLLPADEAAGVVLVDATGGDVAAVLAGALLASRGLVALVVAAPARGTDPSDALQRATALLADVPATAGLRPLTLTAAAIGLPPGVPATEPGDGAAWDALLARTGARPR